MKHFLKIIVLTLFLLIVIGAAPALHSEARAEATYYIEIDITNQYVTVYRKSDMSIVRQMICSTGKPSTPSPIGTFTMPAKSRSSERTQWYTFTDCYAQYASRIRGGILFHSYLFSAKRDSAVIRSSVSALGTAVSHGCIRLRIADAKWIAENVFQGTKVKIYRSGKYNSALRSLLLKETFSVNDGVSYEKWASIGGNGDLGRGATGAKVKSVQQRLVGLGFADMVSDSVYGQLTVDAVKSFQKAAGISKTGIVDSKTWNALFADDAPAGSLTPTLYEGTTGAKVALLQTTLQTLKLYAGIVDGSFGSVTKDAVNEYKRTHGLSENGKMESSAFKTAIAEAADLVARFGDGDYELLKTSVEVEMAKVNVKSYTYLRKSKSYTSKALKKLKKNEALVVLSKGSSWTKVQSGTVVGYVTTRYLRFYTGTNDTWEYGPVATPTPEPVTDLPTVEPSESPSPSPDPLPTVEPSESPTPTPEPLPLVESSESPTPTPEPLPTVEPSESPTPTPEPLPRVESSGSPTPTPTAESTSSADDQEYEQPKVVVDVQMAKVNVKNYTYLRKAKSFGATALKKLRKNADVIVLDKGKNWTKVQSGSKIGYVATRYLTFYTQTSESWEPVDTPTPAPTESDAP